MRRHGPATARARRWRRLYPALATAGAGCAALALALAPAGRTQDGGQGRPLPVLGAADAQMTLLGAAAETGESWGVRRLPLDVPAPVLGGAALEFGPLPAGRDVPQLAFVRHTDDTGWQIAATPRDADGAPYRGPEPNLRSASVTARGAGLLVGRDALRPAERQLVALVHDPGGGWRERRPADGVLADGEALAGDRGAGRVAATAYDAAGGRAGALFGVVGPAVESAVVRFDGETWTREDVALPAGVTSARFVAVDAADLDHAYALLETDAPGLNGVELYRRTDTGSGAEWRKVSLAGSVFADARTDARGISELGPLTGAADPLTVTASGVWVDGSLAVAPAAGDPVVHDFTLHVDAAGDTLERSWCDAQDVCDAPLGFAFDRDAGYRSFAWGGDGTGTRVVTNPRDPGGDAASNRGTYAVLAGGAFARRRGATGAGHPSGAFRSATRGWLEGPIEIGAGEAPQRLRGWPVAARSVLTAAATAPGAPAGALTSAALAVGADGAVLRYTPGAGWEREFLLTSSGAVSRPRLRGVAWPEPGRAHAVGDLGAMWQWRSDTGLWERDPAAPVGSEAQLMDVAFQPGAPERGYAVGRAGTLLRYDKTWTQETLPDGFAATDLTSVSFAGGQALVAAGADLLVDEGAGWHVDAGLRALLDGIRRGSPQIRVVRGLPDGGAVAAGRGFVAVRDGAGAPWRFTDQPLPDQTPVAVAAFREGTRVRALVSVQPRLPYPQLADPGAPDPDAPAPVLPAQPLPGDGYLLRETAAGWRDEQRTALPPSGVDRPVKSDPVAALLVDAGGAGWAIGGWSGQPDFAGRGTRQAADAARVQTAAVQRYQPEGEPPGPPARAGAPVATDDGPLRLAIGGHAQCEDPCADLADQQLGPDRTLRAAIDTAAALAARPGGPRAFLNTGGRLAPKGDRNLGRDEARRYAELLASPAGLPVYSAVSASDSGGGTVAAFSGALAGAPAPFGTGALPAGIGTDGIPGATASGAARTHYAFEVGDGARRVRVVVIDNSRGSLEASDPHQVPLEPQLPWLVSVLDDARARGIAAVVVGSRDLSRFTPRLNAASDGDAVAQVLVDHGASAYFYERPEENRAVRIPSGAATTIPAYGTGTLGYRSPFSEAAGGQEVPLGLFGDRAFLLAEIDTAARDALTNRAPVTVRAIPVIEDLSLQAIDGTLLRRSRPSLFQGIGRRPAAGDRWGEPAGGGPSPPGGDPYTVFPAEQCVSAGCSSRIVPEATFTSSDPDIGDFVRQDPASANLRKPYIDPATDKVVSDPASALFCPFNAGTTTVTVRTGGIAFSQKVTVLNGTVARPCGTRPLSASRFERETPTTPAVQQPRLPDIAPSVPPTPDIPLPPAPPAPAPAATPPAKAAAKPVAATPVVPPLVPLLTAPSPTLTAPPAAPPPPGGGFARPIPPGGVAVRVFEHQREEQVAPEESQAFSRYEPDAPPPVVPIAAVALLVLAAAGADVRGSLRRRDRPAPATVTTHEHHRRSR